ncbi:hypothetical protein JTL48_34125, partial [Pseudomonas aeruginosa]|nr:hypothetical protein [Pseudomonas aeruginosa]
RPGSWFDHLVSVAVFAAMSFPTFFLCLLLIKWFAVDLHWLPVGGMTNTGSDESGWQYVLQVAAHLALPVLALVLSIALGVAVGGAGSITFPLPALIWCAVRYPLPLTCLLTFLTGIGEILLVANSLIHFSP